jgi:hypothetical protein
MRRACVAAVGVTARLWSAPARAYDCSVGGEAITIDSSINVLWLTPDGFDLTGPRGGVLFDLNADGIPELVSWTKADSDDAWLAFDRNGNGKIDDGSELFGNHTPAVNAAVYARNGFEALKFLEAPEFGPSRADMRIDQRDAPFEALLLWTDRNQNGISEPDELQRACEAGLVSIGTDYEERKRHEPWRPSHEAAADELLPRGKRYSQPMPGRADTQTNQGRTW